MLGVILSASVPLFWLKYHNSLPKSQKQRENTSEPSKASNVLNELTIDFWEKIDHEALIDAITLVSKDKNLFLDIIGYKINKSAKKLEIFIDIPEKVNKADLKEEIYQRYNAGSQKRQDNGTVNFFYIERVDNLIDKNQVNLNGSKGKISSRDTEINMDISGDTYNVGQAGSVGKYSRSDNNTFIQSEQKQILAESVGEIRKILKQLEQANPGTTESEMITFINDETSPSFKRRVVSALQSFGEAALDEFILENKYLKVIKETVKGWLNPDN
jgi:hypothetical protein